MYQLDKWKKYLAAFGLSDSEITLYLASLEMGPQSVLQLSKKTKLSRVTIYAVIETLTEKGLMSSIQKGKKQYYAAEPPERLVSVAEKHIHNLEGNIGEMKAHLQELKLVQSGDKPVVKMFEGKEGLVAIQQSVLDTKTEEIREFGNLDNINKIFNDHGEHFKKFFNELESRGVKRRAYFLAKEQSPVKRTEREEYRVISQDKEFHGDILIYEDKVSISTLRGKLISV
ncbi:MAG: hypothetical protein HOC34_02995, partial [Candidatus Magasanikbacteria bacterium]|nr:hypothetical protein [Candidatus Magasanikbacteria bacterium]